MVVTWSGRILFLYTRSQTCTTSFPTGLFGVDCLLNGLSSSAMSLFLRLALSQDVDEFLLVFLDRLEAQLARLPQKRLLQHVFG